MSEDGNIEQGDIHPDNKDQIRAILDKSRLDEYPNPHEIYQKLKPQDQKAFKAALIAGAAVWSAADAVLHKENIISENDQLRSFTDIKIIYQLCDSDEKKFLLGSANDLRKKFRDSEWLKNYFSKDKIDKNRLDLAISQEGRFPDMDAFLTFNSLIRKLVLSKAREKIGLGSNLDDIESKYLEEDLTAVSYLEEIKLPEYYPVTYKDDGIPEIDKKYPGMMLATDCYRNIVSDYLNTAEKNQKPQLLQNIKNIFEKMRSN